MTDPRKNSLRASRGLLAASHGISEADLQSSVIEMAQTFGWLVAHFRPAMTKSGNWVTPVAADGKGFPDLVLLRGQEAMVVELKSQKGVLAPDQKVWLEAFDLANVMSLVWRPEDWISGEIERLLR